MEYRDFSPILRFFFFPKVDSQSGESIDHLSSPHRVWTRKCEGGERLARAQHNNNIRNTEES